MSAFQGAYRRLLMVVLGVALLASLYVAVVRYQKEHVSKRVEITMDWSDFDALARSYGYNEEQFLVALRRAGLTSVALGEELGNTVGTSDANATATTGSALLLQAQLTPLSNPVLGNLVRQGRIDPNFIYLVVYNPTTFQRYMYELPMRFPHALRILNRTKP
ncbi:MAG: hypothetical protein JOZ38_01345, partial [Candidatus Eremiobacteraeota bacterium]|nr:hypothetical protein [Candidatus Eremiobacteraeota bacterium]